MRNKLQVISGALRGKNLKIPGNARPTQARARAAVMNMLAAIFPASLFQGGEKPLVVWDAFAGSGALGIEFASRFGAARAIFTDTNPDSIAAIRENTASLDTTKVATKQVSALRANIDADIVFIDPPYDDFKTGEALVKKLAADAAPGTIIVWEMEASRPATKRGEKESTYKRNESATFGWGKSPLTNLEILRDRTHGRARFLIMRKV